MAREQEGLHQDPGTPPTNRHRRRRVVWAAVAVVVVVVVAAALTVRPWDDSDKTAAPARTASTSSAATALQDAFIVVVARARSSIVEISTPQGLGSGVVYDTKGDIVTNAHVVEGASSFKVTLTNGSTLDATLIGVYPPDDLAVVKVSGPAPAPATFADSSKVQVGQMVFAIGNPLGLSSSVTNGIVSATGRTVSEGGGVVLPSTIQTSAPINPGNSGGGLVDLNAAVIGIPTLAATDPQLGGGPAPGIGFVIPSNTVKLIADQLIANGGKVTNSGRAALGIVGTTVVSGAGTPVGVLVRSASPPASSAGIKPGDIISAVNGTPTPTSSDLATVLAGLAPGDEAKVTATSPDGSTHTYTVKLGTL